MVHKVNVVCVGNSVMNEEENVMEQTKRMKMTTE